MDSSSRHLHAQPAKLTRGRAIGGAMVIACLVPLLIAAWPGQDSERSVPLVEESKWLEVALRMEAAGVPPRELLGAPLESETLLSYLATYEISAESFRATSERIRENAIRTVIAVDDRTEHVLADMPEMPDLGLPEGIQLPRFGRPSSEDDSESTSPESPRIAPELRCAQRLIDTLAAPLQEDD